jgi:spore germination protein KC
VSIQVFNPLGQKGDGSGDTKGQKGTFIVESEMAKNMFDAQQKLQQRLSRHLYKAHRRVVLIGERMARKGIKDIMDQFSRDPKNRLRTEIMVVKGGMAKDILQIKYPFEHIPGEAYYKLAKMETTEDMSIKDFLLDSMDKGIRPTIAAIEPTPHPSLGQETNMDLTVRLYGMAIIKDYKLVGFLDHEETKDLLLIKGKLKGGIYIAPLPEHKGMESLEITASKQSIKIRIHNDVNVDLNVSVIGEIHENSSSLDLSKAENITIAEEALKKTAEKRFEQLIKEAQQKYKADIFGFGKKVHQTDPKYWRKSNQDWGKQFTTINVNVTVQFHIKRSGMIGSPTHLEQEVK